MNKGAHGGVLFLLPILLLAACGEKSGEAKSGAAGTEKAGFEAVITGAYGGEV